MNKLVQAMENEENLTLTENGAKTFKSTTSALLDFFALGGALRTRSTQEIVSLFSKAFAEDKQTAIRTLFYFRDIRGGQGERKTFRDVLKFLGENHPSTAREIVKHIPEYGRWDDIFSLFGTPVENDVIKAIKQQVLKDTKILANSLPSSNNSCKFLHGIIQKLQN